MPERPSDDQAARVTRLAPSPTGALHLGNARTFVINWAIARQRGWRIVLRIEDMDWPRARQGADREAIDILEWLGIDWDEGPYYQRQDLSAYHAALGLLRQRGLTYDCVCTRSEIAAAQSAPHADEHELRYPGTCRTRDHRDTDLPVARRVRVPDEPLRFVDEFAGPQTVNVQQQVGDFIVATKQDLPAYQLAVVVDDARQGVTDVVRGDDLISSAARQLWLYRLLGYEPRPSYIHVPLVCGEDGRRLAKRHGDTRLTTYRERGVWAQRVLGLLARWSGFGADAPPMDAATFRAGFDLSRLSHTPVLMSAEEERWLLNG
jgi:glutamyl-tRNA synthetase